jgi:phosphohistidine phosphatase
MKTLLIMRHAKSSWDNPDLADHDRPLNSRGRRDAPAMGQRLAEAGLSPQRIVASDATRAVQTAQFVAGACGYRGTVVFLADLYAAPPAAYLSALAALPDDVNTALVVGHNPGLEDLVQQLCGGAQAMPTAAIAHIKLSINTWSELLQHPAGDLQKVWKPKG